LWFSGEDFVVNLSGEILGFEGLPLRATVAADDLLENWRSYPASTRSILNLLAGTLRLSVSRRA
jgi:hypothetical protein